MKPVHKGTAPKKYKAYSDAKPELIARLGSHCSYCEVHGKPTALHVEHIYPKKAHPLHENSWDNFLLACGSCNSKKNSHFGSGRQRSLYKRYLWPHKDNTARAFQYHSDGRVSVSTSAVPQLSTAAKKSAENTMEMVGFLANPGKAKSYAPLAIAYTGVSIRKDIWAVVESIRTDYLQNPGPARACRFASTAVHIGYFSIWMEVFRDRPEFRKELVAAFNADPQCFDQNTQPVPKGRA